MEIKEVNNSDRQIWNDFVLENKGEFLQSWEWGEFQKATGKEIWRLATLGDNGEILAVALIIRHELPLGKNYLYCPRGPVVESRISNLESGIKFLDLLFDKTKEIAKKEKSVFFRLEPELETKFPIGNLVSKYPASNIQPKDTLILGLTKPEEQLLAEMKPKTRYNIRLAQRHGIKIRISDSEIQKEDFKKFWALAEETSKRDGFKTHPKEYYQKMFTLRSTGEGGLDKFEPKDGNYSNRLIVKLFLAECQGLPLAANIVIFFGNRATYVHGASSSQKRNLMAPYLLQWEQIKNTRVLGFKEYDFWGITGSEKLKVKSEKSDLWEGITRFKKGFGGREINYPQAMDLVYQPIVYKTIGIAKKIKNLF